MLSTTWTRSTRCDSVTCAYARATGEGRVQLRDERGSMLTVTPAVWQSFIAAAPRLAAAR